MGSLPARASVPLRCTPLWGLLPQLQQHQHHPIRQLPAPGDMAAPGSNLHP